VEEQRRLKATLISDPYQTSYEIISKYLMDAYSLYFDGIFVPSEDILLQILFKNKYNCEQSLIQIRTDFTCSKIEFNNVKG